jgi:hypothetical protein
VNDASAPGSTERQTIDLPTDLWAIDDAIEASGWGDGLPIVPPTLDRVEQMLDGFAANSSLGRMPPSNAESTNHLLAVNAVMAGCRPPMFPLLRTIMTAILEPQFNLRGVQASTHPAGPLAIVNGPIRNELHLHGGAGCLGPGWRANATIGRAVRLGLMNIGGARPGVGDRSTLGHAGKYSCVFAENEAESPWVPLAESLGLPPGASAVTILAAEGPHAVSDHISTTPEGLLHTISEGLAHPGHNNWYHNTQVLVLLCPEHASLLAAAGLDRVDVQRHLFETARLPWSRFSAETARINRALLKPQPDAATVGEPRAQIVVRPADIIVAVAGGPGRHSAVFPTFGSSVFVTATC